MLDVASTGIYTKLAYILNFKCNARMHVKMNIIAKISCYFEGSVVTLKLRKEYLITVTYNTPVSLRIKYWTIWYIERYSMSACTGVSNFQKTVRFLAHHVVAYDLQQPQLDAFSRLFLWYRKIPFFCLVRAHNYIDQNQSSVDSWNLKTASCEIRRS